MMHDFRPSSARRSPRLSLLSSIEREAQPTAARRGGIPFLSLVALTLLFLTIGFAPTAALAQTNLLPAPTLIPAPAGGIAFEMARLSVGVEDDAKALLAEDITWVMIRVRSADFVYPDGADETFGGRIARLHEQNLKVLLRVEAETPPLTNVEGLLNFVARLAALQPDGIQIADRLNENGIRPELYVGLMRQAYALIKRANPEMLVIGGGLVGSVEGGAQSDDCTSGTCSEDAYRTALADAGLGRFADCIGVRYDAGTPLAAVNLALTFNPYVESFPDKPLCLTLENVANPRDLIRAARDNGRIRLLILEDAA